MPRPALRSAAALVALALPLGLVAAACSSGDEVTSSPTSVTAPAGSGGAATSSASGLPGPSTSRTPSSPLPPTGPSTSDDVDVTVEPDPGAQGPPAPAVTPACDLLTEEVVTEALGEPVVAGDQRTDECWWASANDLKTVNLIRRNEDDLDTWRSGYDNPQWEPVGLGDEGYRGRTLDSVVFRIGDTTYEVNVVFSTKGDPGAVVDTLAEQVVSRL